MFTSAGRHSGRVRTSADNTRFIVARRPHSRGVLLPVLPQPTTGTTTTILRVAARHTITGSGYWALMASGMYRRASTTMVIGLRAQTQIA